ADNIPIEGDCVIKISNEKFNQLMNRIRRGDESAASELIDRYEPEIRREIRLRLTNPKLRRVIDTMDISQSVFGNFFVRAAYGQFELASPAQLMALLLKMANNKVIDRHRREVVRKTYDHIDEQMEDRVVAKGTSTASSIVAGRELLDEFRNRLSDDEQKIADMRKQGIAWDEIANQLGQNADALRKRLARACDRAIEELGI
ncbi:MAG: ECF-type sigma factor, partial [Cyanobacteria bacterium P01_E01_bin.48]